MNVLLLGSGGREYAIAMAIKKSKKNINLYCIGSHKNPGIYKLCVNNGYCEKDNISSYKAAYEYFACAQNILFGFVFIGPESFLEKGFVDFIENHNKSSKCIGPCKSLALLETSKSFARTFLKACDLKNYCPKFKCFTDMENIESYLNKLNNEYVIKADGLNGGKGVKLSGDHLKSLDETKQYCEKLLNKDKKFLVEEKLYGNEYSLITFTDGKTFKHSPLVKDFKRLLPCDKGPNTGGMGSISYKNHSMPFLNNNDIIISQNLNAYVLKKIQEVQGEVYKGILYGSYMKTNDGNIKIIEYNCRFGDPECINILHLLETDFVDLCLGMINNLSDVNVHFKNKASVCKYLVPCGYPDNPVKDEPIIIPNGINNIIYASVDEENKLKGSRALAFIYSHEDIRMAYEMVESQIKKVKGPVVYRKDIGQSRYSAAGIDIINSNQSVHNIQELLRSTYNQNTISSDGDFAGLYEFGNNILVSSTDGVGTKSQFMYKHFGNDGLHKLGMDLVHHCINDILVKGAKPLFFLDYFASHNIVNQELTSFVSGVATACVENNCVLIGGETAEMPLIYEKGKFDLVGTIVGSVERQDLIEGKRNIKEGDIAFGLFSDGLHTNGYTLVNKIADNIKNPWIIFELGKTHKCYLKTINTIKQKEIPIHGLAHITGGGLFANVKRVLPNNLYLNKIDWNIPPIFKWLQKEDNISDEELLQIFNCGIGMVVFTDKKYLDLLQEFNGKLIGIVKNI